MFFPKSSRGLAMKLKVLVTDLPCMAQNGPPRTRVLRDHGGHIVDSALHDEPAIVCTVMLRNLQHGKNPVGPVGWRRGHGRESVRYFTVGLDFNEGATDVYALALSGAAVVLWQVVLDGGVGRSSGELFVALVSLATMCILEHDLGGRDGRRPCVSSSSDGARDADGGLGSPR